MVSDRDRGAVALLCLFAIVLAAAQFPATGLGSAPDGGGPIGTPPPTEIAASDGDTGGASSGDGGGSGSSGDGDAATETETGSEPATDTPTTAPPTTDDGIDVPTDERAVTDTPTPTRTTTTTERSTPDPTTEPTTTAPVDDEGGSDGSGEDLRGVVVGVLVIVGGIVVVGLVAISGSAIDTDRDRTRSAPTERSTVGVELLGYLPTIAGGVVGALGRLPRRTMGFVIGASRSAPRLFDAVGSAAGQLVTGLSFAGAGAAKALGRAVLKAPGGLLKGLGSLGGAAASGLLSAPSGAGSLLGGLLSDDKPGTDRPGTDARSAAAVDPEAPSEPDLPPPESVTEAWERMVAAAPVSDWEAKTPVEVARDAVRTGLPVEPVGRLTSLFRRVRYDPERPGDDALSAAREALARIERPGQGTGDGGETDD